MKRWPGLLLCAALLAMDVQGAPSEDHRDLSPTACWALRRENVELLRALLQAGLQINEPVEAAKGDETGRTLLHMAADQDKAHVAQFLRDNGASVYVRDAAGDRPIDLAFRNNNTNVCEVLQVPEAEDVMVGDLPEAVLREVIRFAPRQEIAFITFNGADAPKELASWFQAAGWTRLRPASDSEVGATTDGQEGQIRDRKTKEVGLLLKIAIKKTKTGYDWGVVFHESPWESSIQSGGLIKRYGYWIRVNVKALES